jgi:phospholipase/carboxylesterase
MGFSQGGVMSLEAGINYKGKVAAIISMSGYMPDPWETLTKAQVPLDTPILLVHGTGDEVVPVEGSRKAVKALKDAGYNPILREFPMGHQITEESLGAVRDFLLPFTKAK